MPALKPYPRMKDSSIEWLEEMPSHWEACRACHRMKPRKRPVDPDEISEEQIFHYSIPNVQRLGGGGIEAGSSIDSTKILVDRTLLLVSKLNPRKSSIALAMPDQQLTTLASGEFVALEPSDCLGSFAQYLYESEPVRQELSSRVASATKSHQRCSPEDIIKLRAPFPPLPEQTAIARFLDHMDRRIQKYIRAKEKLIALLDEYKQALIHQAVTGQIDVQTGKRYRAYKASGLDWLGDVPAHWDVIRNGQLFAQRNEVGFSDLPILEVSLRSGVRVREFEDSHRKQVMSDRSMYKRAVAGDIAYNMMRMWQGAVGVAPVDGLVSPAYVVARPLAGTEPRYFDHLFHTHVHMIEVDRHSRGIVKDRNRLYWEDFKQMANPCPPYVEQVLIADAVDRKVSAMVESMRRVRDQIGLAKEYGARLVADVVTGKLDVRNAGGGLADVPSSKRIGERMVRNG